MPSKPKPIVQFAEVLVFEKGLTNGTGELADAVSTNNSDGSELFQGQLQVSGAEGPYTLKLVGSAVRTYGTVTLDTQTGAYTYTLSRAYPGSSGQNDGANTIGAAETFSVMVTAANGQSTKSTITINIVDDAPVAGDDTNSAAAGTGITGDVLANDTYGADGPLTSGGLVGGAAGSGPGPISGGLDGSGIAGQFGTLFLQASGQYSYQPNAALPAGSYEDQFVYTMSDGDGDLASARLTFSVSSTGNPGGGTFNVRDYGAVGDGVTNDQAAIQAAIDAAAQAGGGTVYVPPGTYIVGIGGPENSDGPIELLSNVTLQGAGMGITILQVQDNVSQQINGFVRTPSGVAVSNVALLDLTLDGNRANNTQKVNAVLTGPSPGSTDVVENVTISRVEARNFSGYGFDPHERTVGLLIEDSVAHHNGIDGFVADFQIDGVFRNNLAYANDRHGFNIVTSTSNFRLEGNVAHDNGGTGITIQRGSDPDYAFTNHIVVEGGSVYGNGTAGIEVKLADSVLLTGIAIHDNGKQGISILGASNVTVDGNTIEDNGLRASSGYYDAVLIGDQQDAFSGSTFHAQNVSVTNNLITSTGAIRPAFGISEESELSPLVLFTGNAINGMRFGDISMDGLLYDESGAQIGGSAGYDVRYFGAKGDGVTNDTQAIQAAIDAAHAAGGGTVYIGAGTFIVDGSGDKSDGAIRLLDNVTLQGAGIGQTILRVADGSTYTITGVVRTPFNAITHDVGLFDLTIDGNRANTTGKIDGFYTGVAPGDLRQDYNITVERVEIMNCSGYGFDPHEQTLNLRIADSLSHGNGLDGFVADFLVDSVYENNIAYDNDRHGFNVTTSTGGLLLLNNAAYGNGSAGLAIQRGSEDIPAPNGIVIDGGAFHDNVREGIFVKLANELTVTGVEIYGNGRQGIRLDGVTDALVENATVHDNSQETAGLYDEIRLGQFDDTSGASGLIYDSTGVMIVDSAISAAVAGQSRYGIYETPQVEGINQVSGNTITGMTAGATYFAPQLVSPATDQAALVGQAFSYAVPPSSFVDGDDGTFALSARLAAGGALPAWLVFDPATGTFTGTAPANGTYAILVEARDAGGLKATTTFGLVVSGGAAGTSVTGTVGDDALAGGAGADTLYGLAGNDTLAGLAGPDLLDGGDGTDTATYAASSAGVSVSLGAPGQGGDAEGDQLVSIENLIGSGFADYLAGDAGPNELRGGAGDDVLEGGDGADLLDGGEGADTMRGGNGGDIYYLDNPGDVIVEFDNSGLGGVDTVFASISYALAANVENLTLLGSADIDAIGNNKGNVLTGNSGANLLDGGLGSDTMIGGLGNDTYVVNVTGDVVTEEAGAGTDRVISAISYVLGANLDNLTLSGTGAINGTGNALDNEIVGNAGANRLTGNDGNDSLLGGDGNDILQGGQGDDWLDGQADADTMAGGDGNDAYFVDNAGDVVTEYANGGLGGTDTVNASISYVLTTNVENLTLTGTANLDGTGTGAANVIVGNAGNNVLSGLAGNDTLSGAEGDDRLIGGSGSDSLAGGTGQDTAVFAGDRATYAITTANGAIQIKDSDAVADGNDGTDTLVSIETAEFKGGETVNLLAPVVLDLDGDGVQLVKLGESSATFDFRGDGTRTATGWISAGDAFLFLDRDGNGNVSNAGELSFVDDSPGALSDLAGLRAFDSNGDGLLSAEDDRFADFSLWLDNGDGLAAPDEMRSLDEAGIAWLDLTGTATSQTWAEGENIVVNTGGFQWIDGSYGALVDAALLHDTVPQPSLLAL